MTARQVVLISETKLISSVDLFHLAKALEINARHCADAWDLTPPAIDVAVSRRGVAGANHVIFLDTEADLSALAYHYVDRKTDKAAARVFIEPATGFNEGHMSVAESTSHEIVEIMVDPLCDLWLPHPARLEAGVEVALENADPVQSEYFVEAGGTQWRMANFVFPAWFRSHVPGLQLDYSGELSRPGEIGPEGYAIFRRKQADGSWRRWAEDAIGPWEDLFASQAKEHPWGRSRRRFA